MDDHCSSYTLLSMFMLIRAPASSHYPSPPGLPPVDHSGRPCWWDCCAGCWRTSTNERWTALEVPWASGAAGVSRCTRSATNAINSAQLTAAPDVAGSGVEPAPAAPSTVLSQQAANNVLGSIQQCLIIDCQCASGGVSDASRDYVVMPYESFLRRMACLAYRPAERLLARVLPSAALDSVLVNNLKEFAIQCEPDDDMVREAGTGPNWVKLLDTDHRSTRRARFSLCDRGYLKCYVAGTCKPGEHPTCLLPM